MMVKSKTDDIALISLADTSLREVADALTRGYAGYAVAVRFAADDVARRILSDHVDLGRSWMFRDRNGESVGCMLISRRDRQSRISALGIAPGFRGIGLGKRALDTAVAQARKDGNSRIVLEVLSENLPAARIYSAAGFVPTRRLVGYDLTATDLPAPVPIRACEPGSVLGDLMIAYPEDVSWQMSPRSFAGATSPVQGYRTDHGAVALVQPGGVGMRLLAIAAPVERRGSGLGRTLMESLVARFRGQPWSIPAIVPESLAASFFLSTRWVRSAVTQVEMELVLG